MSERDYHLKNARAQMATADTSAMRDEVAAVQFLGPPLLLLGFGIEAFLKAVLLDTGIAQGKLRHSPYGHDLWSMWNMSGLQGQRRQAGMLGDQCHHELKREYVPPRKKVPTDPDFLPGLERHEPTANDFEPHSHHLSELHSRASDYALRYPIGFEKVPEPMLLICVFDRLVRDCANNTTITKSP